jgi:phosphatidate cytidylyltransferase
MYLPIEYYMLLLLFVSFLAMSEFYSMYRIKGILKNVCLVSGLSILGVSYFFEDFVPDIIILSVMVLITVRLFMKRDPFSSLSDLSPPLIGLLYIPGLFIFQTYIRKFGPEWIIFLYATVWAADSMAYYIGRGIGKRRLYVEISPNKTVAGAAGSVIGGIAGAILLKTTILTSLTLSSAIAVGIMIGMISVIGDLVESMFKRNAGVKDSGVIIPGHGGVLDKIDGALFTGPVLYWTLTVMGITRHQP